MVSRVECRAAWNMRRTSAGVGRVLTVRSFLGGWIMGMGLACPNRCAAYL